MKIIIDIEFTGLDNQYLTDNEVIQFKALNTETGKMAFKNFNTTKPICAYAKLSHRCDIYEGVKFSKLEFSNLLAEICTSIPVYGYDNSIFEYYGFGVENDKKMLAKYGININIIDIRELLQLSEFKSNMATEGSGLEATYLIVTGKYPELVNHDGLDELKIIHELFNAASQLKLNNLLTVMPHGFCAGMPLFDYISSFRRAADGYRYNNNDILAKSLDFEIECYEDANSNDDFDDDDI